MALLRKINRVLLMLLILMAMALLYKKTFKARPPAEHSDLEYQAPGQAVEGGDESVETDIPVVICASEEHLGAAMATINNLEYQAPGQAVEGGDESVETDIPVVICASEERLGAAMATINSVYSNTQANVFFYIVTLRDAIKLIRQYIERTKLKEIRYKILEFNPMVLKGKLNFVRFYLPLLAISDHRRIVYLDDDVIVQGDIQELYSIRLEPGHAAAFASDCDLPSTHEMVRSVGMQTTYMGFLDYRKQEVRDLGINPSDCSFNPGVFVADVGEWKKQKITKQLEKWMSKNFKENLYSSAMAGGVATPPMLIVFHDRYTTIDPKWHVRHLGNGTPLQALCGFTMLCVFLGL
ncbi:hypothetical protein NFI96_007447 [Prochilodus magdalenae]|nr:hypothetical protein NFI96_007447 [Prochilodus magdalenae]